MHDHADERPVNRRLTPRRTCHLAVRYRLDGEWCAATAMDASRHGCRLRLGRDVARGATVAVSFSWPVAGDLAPVEAVGRVIWCRVEGLSYQVGVHFADAPAELETLLAASPC
jgi:hypothetical protein